MGGAIFRGRAGRAVDWLGTNAAYAGVAVILALALPMAPSLYRPSNFDDVIRQAAILGVVGIGQTLVLLGRGFDLSVGAVMGLTATAITQFAGHQGEGVWKGVALALAIGLAVGAVNGWLVVRRQVPAFVATLGMFILVQGLRLAYTKGAFSGTVPGNIRTLAVGWLGPVPVPLLIWAILTAVFIVLLRGSFLGRWLYASGANPLAARLSGVPVGAVVGATFVLSGALAVVGGVLLTGYTGYVDRYMGSGAELDSITAALIGGTSFAGGQGGVAGTVAGALLLTLLMNLIVILNLNVQLQLVVKGVVLILAVSLQGLRWRTAGAAPS